MRTFLVGLFLVLFAIVSIPLYLVEFIIGKINPHAKVSSSQFIVSHAMKFILKVITNAKVTVKGLENVPKDEPILFVSNHRSYYDILMVYTTTPKLTGFVAKKEMERIPCISRWMRYLNCVFLDRDDIRAGLKTILTAIDHIKEGYSVHIAPEGTRNQGREMLPFKEGSFKIAQKTGCLIVPVAINNTDKLFENQFPWIRKANVSIEYGKPIQLKDLDPEDKKHPAPYVQEIIRRMYEANQTYLDSLEK
ncbi:1-acylglycerol-3-phosphate O-acyltransferase [Anaerolentibacter hominis]|uniref:lysophospholipid acyltransferase family protein n=1 Tax=Anaerolentibacter hominis TaxID=3079009 RepID=UPI0031B83324